MYDPHVGSVLSCSQFSLSKHGVWLIGGTVPVAGPHAGWPRALRAVCQREVGGVSMLVLGGLVQWPSCHGQLPVARPVVA
jgi:hypothetical protein